MALLRPNFAASRFGPDRSKRIGGKSSSPQKLDRTPLDGGGSCIDGAATGESRAQVNTSHEIGGRGGVGIQRQSRLKRGFAGLSGLFGISSSARKTTPGEPSVDAGLTPAFGNNSQGEGGEARGQTAMVGQQGDTPTAARRIGRTLSALPLSKIKIVIGKRTLDAATDGYGCSCLRSLFMFS